MRKPLNSKQNTTSKRKNKMVITYSQ